MAAPWSGVLPPARRARRQMTSPGSNSMWFPAAAAACFRTSRRYSASIRSAGTSTTRATGPATAVACHTRPITCSYARVEPYTSGHSYHRMPLLSRGILRGRSLWGHRRHRRRDSSMINALLPGRRGGRLGTPWFFDRFRGFDVSDGRAEFSQVMEDVAAVRVAPPVGGNSLRSQGSGARGEIERRADISRRDIFHNGLGHSGARRERRTGTACTLIFRERTALAGRIREPCRAASGDLSRCAPGSVNLVCRSHGCHRHVHEQQISPDSHDRGSGKCDRAGGELVNPRGAGALGRQLLLQAREIQQMVIGRPLRDIAKDLVGADDLPELQRRVGIARVDVGVSTFHGLTEGGPETFSIILRKSPEQIVKSFHPRPAAGFPGLPSKFPPRSCCGAL